MSTEAHGQKIIEDAGQGETKLAAAQHRVENEAKSLAKEAAVYESSAGHRTLKFGEKFHKFLLHAKDAGYALKDARGMLESEILLATRVDWSSEITRSIRVYHTHCHFGDTSLGLPLDMLKALSTFVREDEKTGDWGLNPKHGEAVTKLYNRTVSGKGKRLTAQEFRAELHRIVTPPATPARPSPAGDGVIDLGRPPVESPGPVLEALQVLASSPGDVKAATVLGQGMDVDGLVAVFVGFCKSIMALEDKEQAAADWKYLYGEVASTIEAMHGRFPIRHKKSA